MDEISEHYYIFELKNEALSLFFDNNYNLKHCIALSKQFDSGYEAISSAEKSIENIIKFLNYQDIDKIQQYNPLAFPQISEAFKLPFNDETECYDDLHPYTTEKIKIMKNEEELVMGRVITNSEFLSSSGQYLQ